VTGSAGDRQEATAETGETVEPAEPAPDQPTSTRPAPDQATIRAELDALYAELPSLECRGLCWHSCGPIDMSIAERERIAERGVHIEGYTRAAAERYRATGTVAPCPALGPFRTCGVHDIRPMICRLWGSTETMRCPHGCRPSRELTEAEQLAFLERSRVIGGSEDSALPRYLAELAGDPATRPLLLRYMQGDASVEPALLDALRRRTGRGAKKRRR
jgi:Fe-S-cluster containining protein